ncbi:MAG TPA: hypothetical protein VJ576_06135 [Rhodocyclaceae bacterium]|nr:hypothetical protein [Rhodocyclaceae bacterium]
MSVGGKRPNLLPGLLAGSLFAAYTVLSHYISVLPEGNVWALLAATAPLGIVPLDVARRRFGAVGALVAFLGLAAAFAAVAPYLMDRVGWIYFLQHVAINGCLGWIFGRTLFRGRQPLCTVFASFLPGSMSPAVVRYTRQVTVAWSAFFFCLVATSILLFFLAPMAVWSAFANLMTFPLIGLMFVLDYIAKRFLLPPEDQMGPTAAIRAYQAARRARTLAAPSPGTGQ